MYLKKKLIDFVSKAGWIAGKLPGRSRDVTHTSIDERNSGKPNLEQLQVLPEYELARELVKAEFPLLIVTGGAGTGKSTFISWLSRTFDGHVLTAAPTGVAALNIEGKTLHSLCAFPPAWILDHDIKFHRPSLARAAKLLIIDEISMVNANLLDGVSGFFKLNRNSDAPFGGLSVVLIGDLFQLPPVVDSNLRKLFSENYKTSKFHGANAIKKCSYYAIELTKTFRQTDDNFVELLSRIREGVALSETVSRLNQACLITQDPPPGAVWLSPRNIEVDRRNSFMLDRLSSPTAQYIGELKGKFKNDQLPAPLQLELRVGAQVMFTRNGGKYVNGSIGIVEKANVDNVHIRLVEDGNVVEVGPAVWEQFDYKFDTLSGKIERVTVGKYSQIPLILAWSITIHKSQGKTIDRVHLDLGAGAFEAGQTYVALSRCRSLEKLTLSRPLTTDDIKVDPESQKFYATLRSLIRETPPEQIWEQLNNRNEFSRPEL